MAGAVECRTPHVAAALDTTLKSCKEDTGQIGGFKMARNRMLNPEFWLDEQIAGISAHARLLYMGLWGICDDNYATFPDKPSWIKIQVFPYEDVSIPTLLSELEGIGKIIPFDENGQKYWYIKNFLKNQTINRPSKPKYPRYKSPSLSEYSVSTHPELKEKKRKEGDFLTKIEKPKFLKDKFL